MVPVQILNERRTIAIERVEIAIFVDVFIKNPLCLRLDMVAQIPKHLMSAEPVLDRTGEMRMIRPSIARIIVQQGAHLLGKRPLS